MDKTARQARKQLFVGWLFALAKSNYYGSCVRKQVIHQEAVVNLIQKLILFDIWDFNLHIEWLLSKMVITEIKNRGDYQIDS